MSGCLRDRNDGMFSCFSKRAKGPGPGDLVGGPEWKDDRLVEDCENCGIEFNVLVRRHHCRYCGGVFCRVCTHNRQRLVIYGMVTPVRVCLRCNGHVIRCEDFATAVTRNEILMVKKMLSEKKYKVNGYTGLFPPLYIACKYGHFEVCKVLLQSQAKVNYCLPASTAYAYECSACGRTSPLRSSEALTYKEFKCLNCQNSGLITDLADLDHTGYTALHQAVKRPEQINLVELLLEHKANPEVASRNGNTALMVAAESGLASYCKILLQFHAKVNTQSSRNSETALHRAVKNGSTEVVRVLVEAGADLNVRTNENLTPLDIARHKNFPEIIPILESADFRQC